MDILREIGFLACIAFLGYLFNMFVCAELDERVNPRTSRILFILLLVAELVAGHFMFQSQLAESKARRYTAYTIAIPNGISCIGHYYSGKNEPITVICRDGRKFVAQYIQVVDTVIIPH